MVKIKKLNRKKWVYVVLLFFTCVIVGLYLQQQQQIGEGLVQEEQAQEDSFPYSGEVLSGYGAYFLEFNKKDYEKAKSEDKVILLHFVTETCRECRLERQDIEAGFETLFSEQLVGFKINYHDGQEDPDERALIEHYKITVPKTKIVIQGEKILLRTNEVWDGGRTIDVLSPFIENTAVITPL